MDFLEGDVAINGNALDEEAAGEPLEREERGDFLEGDVVMDGNALDEEAAGEPLEREERGLLDLGFWLLAFGF